MRSFLEQLVSANSANQRAEQPHTRDLQKAVVQGINYELFADGQTYLVRCIALDTEKQPNGVHVIRVEFVTFPGIEHTDPSAPALVPTSVVKMAAILSRGIRLVDFDKDDA